ncbi:C2 domain-containing protein [Mycena sanguinolenta]|uniref:C2 domain-containing protein n=1 Tax=Mycena sanguinolenta TaxID=230812 RepID=A0A8H6Z4X3_9AGAR|nr:C2 domain-containing protein [Mycena sanguinolenta]
MPPTYTVQITFDRAKNLPVADIGTLSSDPYVLASIVVPEAEPLKFRTPTIRRTRNPTWNCTWFVAGVPADGFKLEMILYDEDPGPKISQDRLGKAVARFASDQMKPGFESLETEYVLQKRKGDLHPYILTYLTALLPGEKLVKHNRVVVSVRVLRKDEDQAEPRLYTLGPNRYSRHFSPLVGHLVNKSGQKDANDSDGQTDGKGMKLSATTFIANKLQLTGPVPRELRHTYVGYKPFINWMFDDSGIAGRILYHGLRRQYRIIYACDKSTVWGTVDDCGVNSSNVATLQGDENKEIKGDSIYRDATPESTEALARLFLDMTAWGEGAKLFTYVITLDGEWRFTETGPEFCIDLLSKHSMHADLAKEIAYSGEFFVRPLKEEQQSEADNNVDSEQQQPNGDATSREASQTTGESTPSRNPKDYELIIDNDSGTYRPKKELLPVLEKWLSDPRRLGGLGKVRTMDGFDKNLEKMKEERKKQKAELAGAGKKGRRMVPVRKGKKASGISGDDLGTKSVSGKEVESVLKDLEHPIAQVEKQI